MKSSPLANKDEFMEEALALAHSGVVSLLIDAPQARNDWVETKGGLLESVKQQSDAAAHQVTDLRRGLTCFTDATTLIASASLTWP